ncbi:MAG: LuxR family transcriptional regulator [Sphingomonas sp.]|nr:LuxR family transcriptional regulator [Sphingomonas sp.]
MSGLFIAREFFGLARQASTNADLMQALACVSISMGFDYFALTHHVDFAAAGHAAVRLHNYPDDWVAWFDARRLGVSDPVHRASQATSIGFTWQRVPELIRLTPVDRHVLDCARERGIGDGFTVPVHVPGEATGSCSFAVAPGRCVPVDNLPLAQLTGAFAFEAARRINGVRSLDAQAPTLTERQRDCVLWMARGKTDWEIARILGLSQETVTQHLKQARERYGVPKRSVLAVRALFDGLISFSDIFRRWCALSPFLGIGRKGIWREDHPSIRRE